MPLISLFCAWQLARNELDRLQVDMSYLMHVLSDLMEGAVFVCTAKLDERLEPCTESV